jgi:hypothetical protein
MSETDKSSGISGQEIAGYLTREEQEKLLANLHRVLVWVGVREPEELKIDQTALQEEMEMFHQSREDLPPEIHLDQSKVDLHHIIWRLINEPELTDQDRLQIVELIDLLEKKEKQEEDSLKEGKLTHEQAKQLFIETAGVIRALMDLKDLQKSKMPSIRADDLIRRKVSETKKWNKFLDKLKKDEV